MTIKQPLIFASAAVVLALSLPGCQKEEGPMEKAGKTVDQASEKAKDAVAPKGPLERAGESADKAVEKAREAGR
jgi:hypothetical protein